MAGLLRNKGGFFNNYEIIVAAGNKAGMGDKALLPVKKAIGNDPLSSKTITLSCGKLTTGVSVQAWTGIFILRNTTSPETYFQAAFRVQSPWSYSDVDTGERHVLKEHCYVFDFAPSRALSLIAEYSSKLTSNSSERVEAKVEEFLRFLPVLCFDGSEMQSLNPNELLDIATSGMASTMLARRWQSNFLINLDVNTLERLLIRDDLLAELANIEGFRNLANLSTNIKKIVSHEEAVKKVKRERLPLSSEMSDDKKRVNKFREDLKRDLKKFLTRIPIFMYLTDYREERLIDVIRSIEPDLFVRVTGIKIKTFNDLVELGLFNSAVMNAAVLGFKQFEEASLSYAGGERSFGKIRGFDE